MDLMKKLLRPIDGMTSCMGSNAYISIKLDGFLELMWGYYIRDVHPHTRKMHLSRPYMQCFAQLIMFHPAQVLKFFSVHGHLD